jgi:hypothetical protein
MKTKMDAQFLKMNLTNAQILTLSRTTASLPIPKGRLAADHNPETEPKTEEERRLKQLRDKLLKGETLAISPNGNVSDNTNDNTTMPLYAVK